MDPDATPPEGIPAEEPTSPDLAQGLRCPECNGMGMVLTVVELNDDGMLDHAVASPCALCKGARTVSRAQFRSWHARREGRP